MNTRNNRGKKNIFHGKRYENGNMQQREEKAAELILMKDPYLFLGLCALKNHTLVISDTIICISY